MKEEFITHGPQKEGTHPMQGHTGKHLGGEEGEGARGKTWAKKTLITLVLERF